MRARLADEIFNDALELDASAREVFLTRSCGADDELRREVESLLVAYERSNDFMVRSRDANERDEDWFSDARNLVGETIGRYRVSDVIAVGGMGAVYRAEREDAGFRQEVAIKVIRRDVATPGMIRRFQRERQTLANLEHAGITRLIDGDTTADGLPYLVMELVEGEPIDRYCRENRLTVDARLGLFLKACDAVQFAHQHLVVHRDLKPANILVTGMGEVKLCDFGIAKLLDTEGDGTGGETVAVFRLLTPQYASPEQIAGGKMSTATDVYALGAFLYELLTTSPLREPEERPARGAIIEEPARPSSRVMSASGEDSVPRLRRRLRGDLDTITLKALRTRPDDRYSSVQQMAEDIRCHLAGLPVHARPQTLAYRARKFSRRHRASLSGALVVLVSLVITVIVTGKSLVAARRAEALAIRNQQTAESASLQARRVGAFLQETLASANPLRDGGETTIVDLLEDATSRARIELKNEPAVAAEVYFTIGKTYGKIWGWGRAEETLGIALGLRRELFPRDSEEIADCLTWYGRALTFLRDERAIAIQREGLAIREKLYPPDHTLIAESQGCLGYALWHATSQPDYEEAVNRYEKALAIHRSGEGVPTPAHARMAFSYGVLLRILDRGGESGGHFREALAIYRASDGQDDRYMLACVEIFASALQVWGRPREALNYANEAIGMMPVGLDEDWRSNIHRRRAAILRELGDHRGALADVRRSLVIRYQMLAEGSDSLTSFLPQGVSVLNGAMDGPFGSGARSSMLELIATERPGQLDDWLHDLDVLRAMLMELGESAEAEAWRSAIDQRRGKRHARPG